MKKDYHLFGNLFFIYYLYAVLITKQKIMRKFENTPDDLEDVKRLKAEPWQIDLLKLNPSYVWWGCYEDSMSNDSGGWTSRVIQKDWKDHDWALDEYNEIANFYFEVYRKNHNCPHCDGTGLNKKTHQLSEDWYDFAHTGRRWSEKLTDVEVLALAKAGRLHNFTKERFYFDDESQKWMGWKDKVKVVLDEMPQLPTAEEVNQIARGKGIGHDAINRWVCIEARAKHLGFYGHCEHCESGVIYDEDNARVALQLWYLHPRKGASRGVYIENINQEDVPSVIKYLKEARDRNNERFSKL